MTLLILLIPGSMLEQVWAVCLIFESQDTKMLADARTLKQDCYYRKPYTIT